MLESRVWKEIEDLNCQVMELILIEGYMVVDELILGRQDAQKKWITVVREIQKKLKGGQVYHSGFKVN